MAIDLFPSLAEIGKRRNMEWFDKLSDEDKKSAHPFVLGRWLTGTSDPAQIVRLNTFVNPYMFSLGNEKALLFKLLASACTGSTGRYQWLKAPGSGGSTKMKTHVVSEYYDVTTREADLYLKQIKDEDILEMAEELGLDKDEIAQLKKELKSNESGSTKAGSTKSKSRGK